MAKNDYRRSLIMLRGMEKGYAGHARLETRVLSGTLNFTVGTPVADETLCAVLIGRRGGQLTGAALGNLRDDGRGQKGLMAAFDPRNIAGMDLGMIAAAVIARPEAGGATPVMYGWINGSTQLDWAEVRALLPALCGGKGPAPAAKDAPDTAAAAPRTIEAAPAAEADIPSVQPDDSLVPEETPRPETEATASPDDLRAEPSSPEEVWPQEAPPEEPASLPLPAPAGDELGLDMEEKWPEEAEDLRALFRTHPRFEPFDMPGFVFVRAAMAEETHIDSCAVGIRAEEGRVTGVCYAIPMPYSAQPPAGLEEAVWLGDSNNGWWVTVRDIPGE